MSDGIFPYTQYSSVLYRKEWPLAVNTIIVVEEASLQGEYRRVLIIIIYCVSTKKEAICA